MKTKDRGKQLAKLVSFMSPSLSFPGSLSLSFSLPT